MMCLDESLKRLGTDYIDVYLLHVPSADWQDREHVLDTLKEMKASGKTRFAGLAMWGAADSLHALNRDEDRIIDVLEVPFNILNKSNPEVIRIAKEREIPVMTSEPLCSGILTGKYGAQTVFADGDHRKGFWSGKRWEELRESLAAIEICAKEQKLSMSELALAYNLSWPGISCVIPGGRTAEQVKHNAAAAGLRIPDEVREKLFALPGFVY